MNLKVSIKYQLNEYKWSILVFYSAVISILSLLLFFAMRSTNGLNTFSIEGFEGTSLIFLFFVGLFTFKDCFGLLIQNSISRKTIFISKLLSILIISIAMTLMDKIISFVVQHVIAGNESIYYLGLFREVFSDVLRHNAFLLQIVSLLFNFTLYLTFITFGLFLNVLYYRMNKALQIAVSVGVPVCLFIIIPLIDARITNNAIQSTFFKTFNFAYGLSNHNPYYSIVTSILNFAFFSLLIWLLMRKATIKNS